jgi:TonB family protein
MVCLSAIVHVCIFVTIVGLPFFEERQVHFSPVYTVHLVDEPRVAPRAASRAAKKKARKKVPVSAPPLSLEKKRSTVAPPSDIGGEVTRLLEVTPARRQKDAGARPKEEAVIGGGEKGRVPGASSTVAGKGTSDVRFQRYYTALWRRIREAWVLPGMEGIEEDSLEAIVVITVARDGTILAHRFERHSGNPVVDESVVRAIKKADPLPPLPEGLRGRVLEVGIRFFPSGL